MSDPHLRLMKNYIDKAGRLFRIVLIAVVLLEAGMLVRGLFLFNLERIKLRLYLYSYIFLLVVSLAMLIYFWIYAHNPQHLKRMVYAVYAYTFCFIMWAAFVTCIDCYANGDSGIMVYVVISISMGVLTLLKPWVYIVCLAVSSIFLLTVTAITRAAEPYSFGFYFNYCVFLATSIFLNAHNYRLSLREFQAKTTLEQLSDTDQLTGLYNRRRLNKTVLTDADAYVLIVLDIDRFKQVNDSYGHHLGDTCLQKLAQILTDHFGQLVFRMGGDEFAIVSSLNMDEICQHIDAVNRELSVAVEGCPLSVSAGICNLEGCELQWDSFRCADRALYRVKQNGGGGWTIYEDMK